MLRTWLTKRLGIRYPVLGASTAGVAWGRLARAVSEAGGIGMLSAGARVPAETLVQEANVAGDGGRLAFGIELTAGALPARPDLLDTMVRLRPALASLSFGPVLPRDVKRLH